jgi:hypothetical protein
MLRSNTTIRAARNASSRSRCPLAFALVLATSLIAFGPTGASASGATFTVNSTADNTTADQVLTLREALLLSNGGTGPNGLNRSLTDGEALQLSGCLLSGGFGSYTILGGCGAGMKDTIAFALPKCPCAIIPTSALPATTDPIVIDGYTQPGSSPNGTNKGSDADFQVALDGFNAGPSANGLVIGGGESTVRGLIIAGFAGDDVQLTGEGGNAIVGDLITLAGHDGIYVNSQANQIGSVLPADYAVINGNGAAGIEIAWGMTDNFITHTWIGTDTDGTTPEGNGGAGISTSGSDTTVSYNVIANNQGNGIEVLQLATHNWLRANRIYANGGLGIDLGGDGVTANDNVARDADGGENGRQNYPVLKSALHTTGQIQGKLVSAPNAYFRIEIYSAPKCDKSQHGQGKRFLAEVDVTTDANGVAKLFTEVTIAAGSAISATATSSDFSTSEFSRCVIAQ